MAPAARIACENGVCVCVCLCVLCVLCVCVCVCVCVCMGGGIHSGAEAHPGIAGVKGESTAKSFKCLLCLSQLASDLSS